MKRYLLAAVNAKYIHSNLAVYCLRSYAAAKGYNVGIAEYTINQQTDEILKDLYGRQADLAAFSCYIWNIDIVCRIIRDYKKVCPDTVIWLGGPEASYRAKELLCALPEVTGVMVGEGEETFAKLLSVYGRRAAGEAASLQEVSGIVYRTDEKDGDSLAEQLPAALPDFARLPFPYGDGGESVKEGLDLTPWENRILYYESSRGCPFSCSYCLSSIEKKVRFRDMDLVKRELAFFLAKKVPQVKFIDRTFNCDRERTLEIWNYIKEHDNGITNFHFEIEAELLDDEELKLLATLRPGLVKVEIGVQSTNLETLRAVHRSTELEKVKAAVMRILAHHNVHVHLDLIAGLPKEDFASFARSFNEVFLLFPHELQLGFLKVLAGSPIAEETPEYEITFHAEPPYEVLSTKWLSYAELLKLKAVCEMLEVYYNSGQFANSVRYLLHFFSSPFDFFLQLAVFYKKKGYEGKSHTRQARYDILLEFAGESLTLKAGERSEDRQLSAEVRREEVAVLEELLIYDMCLREKLRVRPSYAKTGQMGKQELKDCYERFGIAREAEGMHHLERFSFDPVRTAEAGQRTGEPCTVLFSYEKREPMYGQATVKTTE
ncbi:MAG: B12-binding domain-containing radical SAM protein [Lachnospiraceae bacterium]